MGFKNIPGMISSESSGSTPTMSHNIMCVLGFIISLSFIILLLCFFTISAMRSPLFLLASIFLAIAALIVSSIGLSSFKKSKHLGYGFGIAGLVISITGIVTTIIISIAMIALSSLLMGSLLSPRTKIPYTGPVKKIDNYEIRMENSSDPYEAMLATWYWSGDPGDNLIEIPDTYEGITLCAIGDTNSDSFEIKIDPAIQNYVTLSADTTENSEALASAVPEGSIIHFSEVDFTLKVGKNINMVSIDDFPTYGIWNEDGSITFYHIELTYECSPNNPYFDSKGGKLYKNGSDTPILT